MGRGARTGRGSAASRTLILRAAACLWLSAAAAGAAEPASGAAGPVPALPDSFRDAPAIVTDERQIATLTGDRRTFHVERKILLLDRRGFDQADQELEFDSLRSTLKSFSARTRRSDGRVVEVPAELRRESILYKTDQREVHALQFTFPAIDPGSVLEWEYELEEKQADTRDWWETQRDIPVLRASWLVRWPLKESPTHGVEFFSRADWKRWCRQSSVSYGGMQETEMTCERVPAFQDEAASPPEHDQRLRMLVAVEPAPQMRRPLSETMWVAADHWWKGQLDAFLLKRTAVQAKARQIAYGATSVAERIDRVVRWVQENIRVRDDPLVRGLGSIEGQTVGADDILERGGGAPEEVTLLTIALLQDAGVSARAVLVGDRSRQQVDFAFPDWAQVDHLMIQVGWDQGQWGFIDATCRFCQAGIPDWRYCSGPGSVLLVGDFAAPVLLNGIELAPNGSMERWKEKALVHPDGAAEVEGLVAWTGHDDAALRERWEGMTVEGRREEFTQWLGGTIEPLAIEPSPPADRAQYLHVAYRYRRADAALRAGEALLLRPDDAFTGELRIPIQEERRSPLTRDYARTVAVETVFVIPPGFAPPNLPRGDSAFGPGFRFEAEWSAGASAREIVWRGRLAMDSRPIEPLDYERVLAFEQDLRRLMATPLVLEPAYAPEAAGDGGSGR